MVFSLARPLQVVLAACTVACDEDGLYVSCLWLDGSDAPAQLRFPWADVGEPRLKELPDEPAMILVTLADRWFLQLHCDTAKPSPAPARALAVWCQRASDARLNALDAARSALPALRLPETSALAPVEDRRHPITLSTDGTAVLGGGVLQHRPVLVQRSSEVAAFLANARSQLGQAVPAVASAHSHVLATPTNENVSPRPAPLPAIQTEAWAKHMCVRPPGQTRCVLRLRGFRERRGTGLDHRHRTTTAKVVLDAELALAQRRYRDAVAASLAAYRQEVAPPVRPMAKTIQGGGGRGRRGRRP